MEMWQPRDAMVVEGGKRMGFVMVAADNVMLMVFETYYIYNTYALRLSETTYQYRRGIARPCPTRRLSYRVGLSLWLYPVHSRQLQ
jgi:hypothetical protein